MSTRRLSGTAFGTRKPLMNENSNVVAMPPKRKMVCHHGPTNTFFLATPIGQVSLTSCPRGLHSISQSSTLSDSDFSPDVKCKVKLESQLYCDNGYTYTPALHCITWLTAFFSRQHSDHVPAFCPSIVSDDSFRSRVWVRLMEAAPWGTTISYKDLSVAAGKDNASRAVGQAMANNLFMLLVPCHRVVRSDGALGNYAHGRRNSVKQWLQDFEKGQV
ncbi:methylated-DNA--protein-cysteine methyltransferase-like [Littorina saxatilis]|uniref:Methylated-DNA--protein-cysteine methyltransferase n=1 Tax=Littorina saxatilis TaxID=31220 RepID=A0AAN9BXP0_9CAEN